MTNKPSPADDGKKVSLDIGFNLDSLPKVGNRAFSEVRRDLPSGESGEDLPSLVFGFTKPHVIGNPIALASKVVTKHPMQINLFDRTERNEGPRPVVNFLSLRMSFERSLEQEPISPVEYWQGASDANGLGAPRKPVAVFDEFRILADRSAGPAFSTVFEKRYPCWHVLPPENGQGAPFEHNQIVKGDSWADELFLLINSGSFYFTIQLIVGTEGSDEKTYFIADPEMVVENEGGGEDFCGPGGVGS